VGDHSACREDEGSQEVELGHDAQQRPVLDDQERIEVMLLEKGFKLAQRDLPRQGFLAVVMY
jgi:hypothetical protein